MSVKKREAFPLIILFVTLIFFTALTLSGCAEETDDEIFAKADPKVIEEFTKLTPEITKVNAKTLTLRDYNQEEFDNYFEADCEQKYTIISSYINRYHEGDERYQQRLKEVVSKKLEDYKAYSKEEVLRYIVEYNARINEIYGIKPNPAIGMSKDDVLSSAWGEPIKKNITETAYGTSEQWVYDLDGYIYFDNGMVTSIQTSE